MIEQYKCPSCGGAIEFSSDSQKLKCPYCDCEFDIDILNDINETSAKVEAEDTMDNWSETNFKHYDDDESDNLCTYICSSCGGEVIGDDNMGATTCPFCGNNVIIKEKFENGFKPDLVIPFKLDKESAKRKFREYLTGKKLLPKLFADENHLDSIKGVYVPFWVYDANVDGSIKYLATRTRHWTDSKYEYTETSYFDIYREGNISFCNIPVDASEKMPNDLMDSVEPFYFDEAVDFNTAYLAGFFADKYDVTSEENIPRINKRVKKSTEDCFKTTITNYYDTVTLKDSCVNLINGKARYALLPIWILNTRWKENNYVFAMNGQTGKFVGNLPMDKKSFWKYWFISFLIAAGIGAALAFLFMKLWG